MPINITTTTGNSLPEEMDWHPELKTLAVFGKNQIDWDESRGIEERRRKVEALANA